MKRKSLLLSLFTLIGGLAHAQEFDQESIFKAPASEHINQFDLMLDTRYDFNNVFTPTSTELSKFQVNQTRVRLTTKLFDKVSFDFRYSFANSGQPDALEFAFIEYRFNKHWAISAGKLFTAWGSYEIDYNGAELYKYSIVGNNLEVFTPGVNFMYYAKKHKFTFQVSTPNSDFFAIPEYKNKSYYYMFLWEGSLFNDKVKTRYGYSLMQHDASKYYQWVTLGHQVYAGNWIFEADYMHGTRQYDYSKDIQMDNIGASEIRDHAITFSAKYKINKVVPYVRGIYNMRKDLTNDYAYNQIDLQAAVEYYPLEDQKLFKDLRLFAAYIYQDQDFKEGLSNRSNLHKNQIVAGVRWLMPIVKK
ncbi:porin [Myroides pelagicus]|uniref:Porin n=1 Tax=Myroides pelagicus TaxID=270914 RepID=A0A7K1GHY3_9FLAO|nr:porin [Myroides pelagicus]MEC4114136.1 porin [Myroides pelagicus]MTH28496.1 hypothetical protein [Myroides pelagicus]